MTDRRFIEVSFPVKEVSYESAREKNIRHGHISTLHIWWARRPLAASRATNFAALVPATDFEEGDRFYDKYRKELIPLLRRHGYANINEESSNHDLIKNFIVILSKWENSNDEEIIRLARRMILDYNKGVPPKVLDPFGGGGSIPLEALRLGCETYSNDLNPVAVLIQKCTLEYPQKYGKPISRKQYYEERPWLEKPNVSDAFADDDMVNPLVEDVKYWGNWVLQEAKKELEKFYPNDEDGSVPVGYIWARTIPCQNPSCGAEIPLMRQFWLAKKPKKKIALFPYTEGKEVKFKIVAKGSAINGTEGYEPFPEDFDPGKGTVARAVATCPVCGSVIEANKTRQLFREGKSGQRMVAVVTHKPGTSGKKYRLANEKDMVAYNKAEEYLEIKREELKNEWGIDPVPDEPTPEGKGSGAERAFSIRNYNILRWGEIFHQRQKLILITLLSKLKRLSLKDSDNKLKYNIILTYINLAIDRTATYNSVMSMWVSDGEFAAQIFVRQAIGMVWDFLEINPFSNSTGDWNSAVNWILRVISNNSFPISNDVSIKQNNAVNLDFTPDTFNAILTDPPYYDNVPYSYLSDFFYVILKRGISEIFPELFSTSLSPKKNEIVTYSNMPGGFKQGEKFFEAMLSKAFKEFYRILKCNGISVIVYAHKTTAGWETLINSLLLSGLVPSIAWPIHTERETRMRAKDSAALASSLYIFVRKIKREPTAFYTDVKKELNEYLPKKLDRLWNEGISGADFFISGIGASIEVFGKYESVMDYEGNIIRANKLLADVRTIVTDYAVKKILHNGFAQGISDLTRFYILYRWEFGAAKAPFDEANKLAHSVHIDLSDYWNTKSFIKKSKEFINIAGPTQRDIEDLKGSRELIDILHHALKLWEMSRKEEMYQLLNRTGLGRNDVFYRVAQAISETLPNEAKEKKLLDGFLTGRQTIQEKSSEIGKERKDKNDEQMNLFE